VPRAQEAAEEQRRAAAREARRKLAEAEQACASLEAESAARKAQAEQLRSDLQVTTSTRHETLGCSHDARFLTPVDLKAWDLVKWIGLPAYS